MVDEMGAADRDLEAGREVAKMAESLAG